MEREKTNSVTKLVKIIAEEVFDQKLTDLEDIKDRVDGVEDSIDDLDERIGDLEASGLSNTDSVNFGKKSGSKWSILEEMQIVNEFFTFINTAANLHERSSTAIAAKLNDLSKRKKLPLYVKTVEQVKKIIDKLDETC